VTDTKAKVRREVVFISKATPGDDEFVLWLAPRLEAAGYTVFADILSLEPGDRWRKQVTATLQNKSIKALLCCRDSSLEKDGVQEEIGIATDLVKELNDSRLIIPLRLEKFKRLFGIGELQYVDFVGSWASGLRDLLDTLDKQGVLRSPGKVVINPNWENYKKRLAIKVDEAPEVLTSNWLRISRVPETIRYYQPPGAVNHSLMERTCSEAAFPAELYLRGFFSFALPDEVDNAFAAVGKFVVHSEHNLQELLEKGSEVPMIAVREVRDLLVSMFRKSWENHCRARGLYEYVFSKQPGFHVTKDHVPLGKRIQWGRQEQRRSSMLRNSARGKVWQYGVSGSVHFWPFLHFRIKSRVLFAELAGKEAGAVFDAADQQHRLRRSICKGWRNKAWHGRFMAFLELLADQLPHIELSLCHSCSLRLDVSPFLVTAPITTTLRDAMPDEGEEQDESTLGNLDQEDDA
jgi:TIR domain